MIKKAIQGLSKLNGKSSGSDSSYREKKKVYDNMGPEMHNYRVIRACNIHNHHVWADTNPRATIQSFHQQRFAINIWAGIVGE
jgi:hypothetical protein